MNKFLTYLIIILVIIGVCFLIAGFLGPQGIRMERSTVVRAPSGVIYKNISDYRNWLKWSPWAMLDSSATYEYYGSQGQIGAGYKWKGNDRIGQGNIQTISMNENDSLLSSIAFINPEKWKAVSGFKLHDNGSGTTTVTWSFSQTYSFIQRPIMLMIDVEKHVAPDYERGLANLKSLSEQQSKNKPAMEVKEIDWQPHTYLADRSVVDIKNLNKVFMDKMPKAYTYLQKYELKMDGPPSGLYFTWDTTAGKTDLAVAIPVRDASKVSGSFTAITIGRSRALLVDYYGPYTGMKSAHDAIHQYARDKGYKLKFPNIEEYVTDPGTEKDSTKILTKIYYLIQK